MKKFLFLFFAVLLPLTTWAADFTADSNGTTIYYNIVIGGVAVTYGDDATNPTSDNGSGTEEYVGDITIPSSVTYDGEEYTVVAIGANAFRSCSGLTGVEIPETVTELGQYAFRVSGITEITIPGSVTTMGTYLVYQCTSLKSAIIGEGVTELNDYMFYGCTELETVSLPSTLETMNTYIFDGCTKLHDVVLPDGLSSIGNYSFWYCSSLTSINIPSALTSTGNHLFADSGLTSIDLPDNITSVGSYSFQNCTSLKTAKIGKNVESVGSSAFSGCTALEAVYSYRADPPTAQSGSFTNVPSSCILYVPEGSVEAYTNATGWSTLKNNIQEMSAESISIEISEAGYATYYTDVEYVMPAGLTGTTVTGVTKDSADDGIDYVLTMNWEYTEDSVVPANTALVLQGDAKTYECEISSTGAEAPTDNLLMGSTTETTTYGPVEGTSYVFYELSNGQNGVGFYYGEEYGVAFTSGANKAWLPLSEAQATNARFLGFSKGDDTTGISSIESASEKAVSGIYTIQGVRVANTNQPGLYIVDGKKVLVK